MWSMIYFQRLLKDWVFKIIPTHAGLLKKNLYKTVKAQSHQLKIGTD